MNSETFCPRVHGAVDSLGVEAAEVEQRVGGLQAPCIGSQGLLTDLLAEKVRIYVCCFERQFSGVQ